MPRILLSSPVRGISGKFKDSDVCYMALPTGVTYARSAGTVSNPKTPAQQEVRAIMAVVSKTWQLLSEQERNDWQDYAEMFFDKSSKGLPVKPNGKNIFSKANVVRQILGQSIVYAAPDLAPPPPLTSIQQNITEDTNTLKFTVNHSIVTTTGLQVIAKLSPAMRTVATKPRSGDMRYCCGLDSASAKVLPATGVSVEFLNTQFHIEDGRRYGVEVRVVRIADGICSQPIFGDYIKLIV